jgi:hypothetical protein
MSIAVCIHIDSEIRFAARAIGSYASLDALASMEEKEQ